MEEVYNWGMYPKIKSEVYTIRSAADAVEIIKSGHELIARGNGRCYGDSSLQQTIFSTLALNKFISFDEQTGLLESEAGVMLNEILQLVVPRGFFLPVTPGTKFITIGGAVASNIHGKNHHSEGAISRYIESFDLLIETGEILHCSPNLNTQLFVNSIGGMGLTGVILTVKLRLRKIETSFIKQKSLKAKNLDEVIDYFNENQHYTYSVAWIDCLSKGNSLGRSLLMLGEHAKMEELDEKRAKRPLVLHSTRQIGVPFTFPDFVLNRFSVKAFNFLVYNKQQRKEVSSIVHYNPYFYPLDVISNWNKIYGKNGFTQYQFVIPFENGKEGLTKILKKVADSGTGSFLAVLKTFGAKDDVSSPISFPDKGYTLALDFKVNDRVFKLLDELDEIVIAYGGRLYLAKDVRMSAETFRKTYGNRFTHANFFNSFQSNRLKI